jgi:hypothetical protein
MLYKYAEFNLNQSTSLKVVSVEEAIAISDEAERSGLLKSGGLSTKNGGVLCNCCECCCNVMGATIRTGTAHELRSPSRYRARVDEGGCIGCQQKALIFDLVKPPEYLRGPSNLPLMEEAVWHSFAVAP